MQFDHYHLNMHVCVDVHSASGVATIRECCVRSRLRSLCRIVRSLNHTKLTDHCSIACGSVIFSQNTHFLRTH